MSAGVSVIVSVLITAFLMCLREGSRKAVEDDDEEIEDLTSTDETE